MKINKILIVIAIIALTFSVTTAIAGNKDKVGGAGAQQLLIPVGSRGIALGGSFNAIVSGNEAIYWNPAGLAASTATTEATFCNLQWIADTQVNYFAVSSKFGNIGSFGISAKVFDFGEFEETTEFETEGTGRMVSPNFTTLGLTFSRQMTDRIFFGVNAKLISESFLRMKSSAMAFDFGVQYVSSYGVRMGLTLNNFGGTMKYAGEDLQRKVDIPFTEYGSSPLDLRLETQSFELPSTFEIGLAYDYRLTDQHIITFSTNYRNQNYGLDELMGGIEYAFNDMFFVRGGYGDQPEGAADDNIFGFSAGAGFKYTISGNSKILFDYAYRETKWFNANQWFTVSVTF
ncbi:PorV/PorQ family protein [candidate division KSB1 bacterium]|nr:PorV/PorQ family protein [candidate division KSB1 bacterium]